MLPFKAASPSPFSTTAPMIVRHGRNAKIPHDDYLFIGK
jgi:hypothetical protein